MSTIGELIKGVFMNRSKNVEKKFSDREIEGLNKANKVDRLRKLCKLGKRISFVVFTPGTESGRRFHCVHLVNAEVKRTSEGNYIITGIDAELSLNESYNKYSCPSKNIVLTKNFAKDVFRSYRVDRILNGTILFS